MQLRRGPTTVLVASLLMIFAACGSDPVGLDTLVEDGTGAEPVDDLFPDVVDATASRADDGTWTIAATLSSPYDSPERYADSWRVLGPDGTVYGERFLSHDHAGEQPFTRSQSGISIPDAIETVTIQGRDQRNGWGGVPFELDLAG